MDLAFDLFVNLTPDYVPQDTPKRQDRSAWFNMKRMSPEQLKKWRAAYGPRDEAFAKAGLTGRDLVRWKYQRYAKNYLRCIKGVDEGVGKIVETLANLGLSENTVVIYSSDQGFYVGDHGWYDKRWMYEESLKMPLIVKWPGITKAGSVSEKMVQNLDYAPTFLDLEGTGIPADMQGRSLLPLLKGEKPADWRKAIYYHYYEYPSVHMVPRHYGIRTERYKLMHFYQFGDEWEFYDLEKDPDERQNQYHNPDLTTVIADVRGKLRDLQRFYEDDTDMSEKPESWQRQMRKTD
jgi:arylsulfatase A-like enzyme